MTRWNRSTLQVITALAVLVPTLAACGGQPTSTGATSATAAPAAAVAATAAPAAAA
ncbi:MAG: hypothetical protein H7Z42_03315, partial [Roseiflexaceae bacterium]|nr:hypothetical protein [Roseiflexaceae bacterium]